MDLLQQLNETLAFLRQAMPFEPQYGIILGTGLGNLVSEINIAKQIAYADIPHFPLSTVESHCGRLVLGHLGGKRVVAMQGRFHYYEGYDMKQVTYPVRAMRLLGIEKLFISNAAGSVNPNLTSGSIMLIEDHINLMPSNPLIGKNYDELGPRFPDLSQVYDLDLLQRAQKIANRHGFKCKKGVYAAIPGPCLETKAEYTYLHRIGADAVGMSTVPEALVAVHMGLPVFAASVITDLNYPPEVVKPVTLADVVAVAQATEPHLSVLIKELLEGL